MIRWTPQAADDLDEIREFIARDSKRYARLLVERLVQRVDELEHFPRAGRVVPELRQDDIRELIHGSYRIVYRLEATRVRILTVFHASRRFPGLGEGPAAADSS